MAADMSKELRPYKVDAVSIWMGGLDTELARAYIPTLPETKRRGLPLSTKRER
jgi:hypothetical protein